MAEVMNTPFGDVDAAAIDAATEAAAAERPKIEEITIKFAKGLCGEPFMSKNGVELVRIQIPKADIVLWRPISMGRYKDLCSQGNLQGSIRKGRTCKLP